ncbi:MAG: hypothetical protein WCL06_10090 [Bacteroidota bacterium]
MSSVTGHIVNHGSLKIVRSFINGLGAEYNPSNDKIKIANIDLLLSSQTNAFKTVNAKSIPWVNAVNARVDVLKPLDKTLTKVLNSLKSTEASVEVIADARSRINKIKGVRATPKIVMDPTDPAVPTDTSVNQISAAQTDINHIIDNFQNLIMLLEAEPLYDPAETDITTAALGTLLSSIVTANDEVIAAFPAFDNARIARNEVLYGVDGGHEIQLKVKKYVLSIFGAKDKRYHQISGVKFTKPKL